MELRIRAMTDAEFASFRKHSAADYADAHVRAGNWTAQEALRRALDETDALLPAGAHTAGMVLVVAENEAGDVVGHAWAALRHPRGQQSTWIYAIEVEPDHRGRGHGRALLQGLEDEVRRRGATRIGLNVFGDNPVARRLYESAGYEIAAIHMSKPLSPGPDPDAPGVRG